MAEVTERSGPRITALYRYPIKGLTADVLERVSVEAGETLPFDRAFAIENGPGWFDPLAPRHLPKIHFLMLMRNEKLATLSSHFDEQSGRLTLSRSGLPVISGDLSTKIGRSLIEQFLASFMRDDLRGPPRIVSAPNHSFSDASAKYVHIINLASLRDLERTTGQSIDPLRFRPNIIIDGLPAWSELEMMGKVLAAGDVRIRIEARTDRCAATNVDPATGARNMDIPAQLARRWGHTDFGVYGTIIERGDLVRGSAMTIV